MLNKLSKLTIAAGVCLCVPLIALGHILQNQVPVAAFSFSPGNPEVEQVITFDASESTDPDGHLESYEWDLGDGLSAFGPTVSHLYLSEGEFTISLTVTDDDGATDSVSHVIQVGGQQPSQGSWEDLGGSLESGPSLASLRQDRLDVFYLREDEGLVQRTQSGALWSGESVVGGALSSDPDCVARGATFIECFGRSPQNSLWHKTGTVSGTNVFWGAWTHL